MSTAAIRCGKCGFVTKVDSGRDFRLYKDKGGKFSPAHHPGECPKSEEEAEQMSSKKTTAKKKAPTKKKAPVKKKAPAKKKAPVKKTTKKPYSKGRATANKDSKGRFLNHQGRETLKATVYGMLREERTDAEIKRKIAKKFPTAQFNEHATAHLAWYRCMIEKEKE